MSRRHASLARTQSRKDARQPGRSPRSAFSQLNMLRQLGGVFGIAICAAVFAAHGDYASAASFAAGFGPAMGACAGLALLGAVAGLAIPNRPKPASANALPVPDPRTVETQSRR
jgi:hypothetical protein